MAGLIQTMTSPLLRQAEMKIEQSVYPQFQDDYHRIVIAGMKAAFDQSSHASLVAGLEKSANPMHDVAVGLVGLLIVLSQQSKGTMPDPPIVWAGMTLLTQGLDYLEKTHKLQVNEAVLDQATQLFLSTLLPKLRLTPEKMQQMAVQAHQAMQNPQIMAQYHASKGASNGLS